MNAYALQASFLAQTAWHWSTVEIQRCLFGLPSRTQSLVGATRNGYFASENAGEARNSKRSRKTSLNIDPIVKRGLRLTDETTFPPPRKDVHTEGTNKVTQFPISGRKVGSEEFIPQRRSRAASRTGSVQ